MRTPYRSKFWCPNALFTAVIRLPIVYAIAIVVCAVVVLPCRPLYRARARARPEPLPPPPMRTGLDRNGDVLSAIWDYFVFSARKYAGLGFWASSEPVRSVVGSSEADCIVGSVNDFFSHLLFFFIPRQIKTKTRATTVVPSAGRPRLLSLSTFYYFASQFFFGANFVVLMVLILPIWTIYDTDVLTFTCIPPPTVPPTPVRRPPTVLTRRSRI